MTPTDSLTAQIGRWQRNSLLVGIAGVLLAAVAFLLDREQFFRSYLFAYLYWTGMALGCLAILLMHHVVGGKWGMLIRRLCEAGARTLPFMGLLLVPILFGMGTLYSWARPQAAHDAIIQSKAPYLNVPFFIARAVIYFSIWFLYSHLLSKWSAQQDRTGDERLISKMRAISAPGLVVFTLTTTFAFIDWIMSLEPHWFSTIYGAMFMVGEMLESFAFVIALMIILSRTSPIKDYVTPQHIHDLGNMMFAFMGAVGVFVIFAVHHHLVRQFTRRDSLVCQPPARRLGLDSHCAGRLPFRRTVRPAPAARRQASRRTVIPRVPVVDRHPAGRCLLDHRAGILRTTYSDSLDGFCNAARGGRAMAGSLLWAIEIAALAALQGPATPGSAARDSGVLEGKHGRTFAVQFGS